MKAPAIFLLLAGSAFGQTTFDFLWEDQFNLAGSTDEARAVAVSTARAVAIGVGITANGGTDMLVRAYDPQTGTLVWHDNAPLAAGYITNVSIDELDNKVFGAGYAPGVDGSGSDILVRAYDATTGNRLWEDSTDVGLDDFVQSIAAGPHGVYVVGYGGNVNGSPLDFLVRAYDKERGFLLWKDQVNNGGDDVAWRVVAQGNMVFVAGSKSSTALEPWNLILRAYDALTGELAWESVYESFTPSSMAVSGERIYLGGQGVLLAYNSLDGVLAWEKVPESNIIDLAVSDSRIFATGSSISAYDSSGALVWEVPTPVAHAIDLNGDILFAAGTIPIPPITEASVFLVAAYSAENGSLLWDDLSHQGQDSMAFEIGVSDQHVFAVGWAQNVGGDSDFLVRAYGVTRDITP
jgi:PQQ-like domain